MLIFLFCFTFYQKKLTLIIVIKKKKKKKEIRLFIRKQNFKIS